MDELEMVGTMLDVAKIHGLEVEVVWAFGMHRATGDEVEQAVAHALAEWDI